jgi:hypothetical protein
MGGIEGGRRLRGGWRFKPLRARHFVRSAVWKTAKSTANFRKSPVDDAKPVEPPQWLTEKFPVRPNKEMNSPEQANNSQRSANAPSWNRESGNWAGRPQACAYPMEPGAGQPGRAAVVTGPRMVARSSCGICVELGDRFDPLQRVARWMASFASLTVRTRNLSSRANHRRPPGFPDPSTTAAIAPKGRQCVRWPA